MKVCAVDGCSREARTRGWCTLHYHRWWRHGDTDALPAKGGLRLFMEALAPLTPTRLPEDLTKGLAPVSIRTCAFRTSEETGGEITTQTIRGSVWVCWLPEEVLA